MKTTLTGEKLAKAAVNQILSHPETWDQSTWHSECGTKHCFAGWCQILAGKPKDSEKAKQDAKEALGLTEFEAGHFFRATCSLSELHALAANFNRDGYDRDGYDRAGYDRDGYDRAGYDRDGYDRAGYDRDGYDRAGYNRDGYNRDGYDRDGYDRDGYDRAGYDRDGYDRDGYDRDGYNRAGYDRAGYDRDGKKLPLFEV